MRCLVATAVLLTACVPATPSESAIQTAIAETVAAATNTPMATVTPSPRPSPTITPTATTTPTSTPALLTLADDEMLAILLALDDMESGYNAWSDGTGPITHDLLKTLRGQVYADFVQEAGQIKGYSTGYQRAAFITAASVRSWLLEFPDQASAADFLAQYIELWPEVGLEPLSFIRNGEESIAFRGHRANNNDVTEVLFRCRNVVVGLSVAAFHNLTSIEELEGYTEILAQRMIDLGLCPTTLPISATPQPTTAQPSGLVCDCSHDTYKCDDFPLPNGTSAQQCFEYCLTAVSRDIHRLDHDNDGLACEGQ